jgi:cellulose synthase/poly-beta-1,6-N-acetylglucosamine synthase-like glycosyltransferase
VTAALPTCSIVVPTDRRPQGLRRCLEALAELDYPRDRLDAIVVGEVGHPAPERIFDPVRGRIDVSFVAHEPGLPSERRNAGVLRSVSELVAFVDDDCRPEPDWLRRLVERWQAEPEAAVGGHTFNGLASNLYAEASQLIINSGYRQNGTQPNAARFLCSANLLVPRARFVELGGFDETFATAEDRELADRWLSRGWPMRYECRAIVHHAHPIGLLGFARRHWRYGRGARRYWRKRAAGGREPVGIDRGLYTTLARAPWQRSAGRLRLAALLLLWHVLNTAGFLYEAAQGREPAPWMPLADSGRRREVAEW